MNRRHVFGCCVMALLFLSCGLSAQDKVQDMAAEAIETVVKEYLHAVQQGRHAEALALSTFRDNKERTAFQERLKKRGVGKRRT